MTSLPFHPHTPLPIDIRSSEPITEGMSGEKKLRLEGRDGKRYLLRLAEQDAFEKKKNEFDLLLKLKKAGAAVPDAIAFGLCDEGVYTLLSWAEGKELKALLPALSDSDRYALGFEAGMALALIHQSGPTFSDGCWSDRYFDTLQPRLDAYRKEGVPFDGAEEILSFIEDNKTLLRDRPLCRHHGDYHPGNLIVTEEKKVIAIDWETIDFDGLGDPWYEFKSLDTRYPAYAAGQIDGYFAGEGRVPDAFWRLFALYLSAAAITAIVWAKYYAPEELEDILDLNRRTAKQFDFMRSPIPDWYRAYRKKA